MDTERFPRQLAATARFTHGLPRAFTLSPDGRRALFLRTRGAEDPAGCLWLLDDTGEHLLAAPEHLTHHGDVPEAELIRRERAREATTGIVAYSTDAALRTAVLAVDGHLWTVDVTARTAPRPLPAAGPALDPRLDPTGRHVAYVTRDALHVTRLDGGDRALATPEGPHITWGLAEHVAAESMHRTRGHWWAPDGTRLLAARADTTAVRRWWISDPADPARPPREIAYPAAGTANADVTLHVLDLTGHATEIIWDRAAFEYLTAAAWDAHGPLLAVQSRDQRTLHVLNADPGTGRTTLLHEQRDPAWVHLVPGTPARTATGALIHVTDTDADADADTASGTRRLLADGHAVTPPGLQVREVLSVTGESVLFTATDEPTETHLWSYDPAHGAVRLSDGPGIHTGLRAAGTLLLASHTETGRTYRLTRDGRPATRVTAHDATPAVTPHVTWLRAGPDDLRTALLLPSWHRPGHDPLPVLMSPYAGPATQLVTRARTWWLCEAQWFAEAGYAVVIADGRGTPGRGPAWEKTVHGDTLTAPLRDQVTALRATAAHCPALDLGRVAIRGWSYGGTLAAAAVLRLPEIFHAAISGAAPSDQRLYDTHWRERFLGHPGDHPGAYDRSSPIGDAALLRRPLLLVHGLADDNVVPAHTLRMSAALLEAGRPHQVLPLPGGHRPTAVEGLLKHQLAFLREALNCTG